MHKTQQKDSKDACTGGKSSVLGQGMDFNDSEHTMLGPCVSLGKESYLPATARKNLGSH